jgi:putative hydrolase of the HAD superfamily
LFAILAANVSSPPSAVFPFDVRSRRYDSSVPRFELSQTLLIDADDTLWENNIYFERAIADFISFLNHSERSPAEVREILNDVERDCIASHGYGLKSFAHALVKTFERISVEPITPELHHAIHGFAHTIATQPIQLLADVEKTLEYLARRHRLVVVTKGDPHEQSGKVERSGLKKFFAAIEVVSEKDEHTYAGVIAKHDLEHERTWMVGNSPKSDINPAIRAGINAVFVPHNDTWILEHEEVMTCEPPRQLLVLRSFRQLAEYF